MNRQYEAHHESRQSPLRIAPDRRARAHQPYLPPMVVPRRRLVASATHRLRHEKASRTVRTIKNAAWHRRAAFDQTGKIAGWKTEARPLGECAVETPQP